MATRKWGLWNFYNRQAKAGEDDASPQLFPEDGARVNRSIIHLYKGNPIPSGDHQSQVKAHANQLQTEVVLHDAFGDVLAEAKPD